MLLVCHTVADRDVAERIAACCRSLGIPCTLDERNDWLMHGLRAQPRDCDRLVVVVSEENRGSWWLPFQLGRAVERGLNVLPFVCGARETLPDFLRQLDPVFDLAQLERRLSADSDPETPDGSASTD